MRLAGPPGRQLEVLRQLGEVGADPLASLLALLALAAEGLAAYLLAVLGLRLLAMVPGVVGRLAAGATVLATPAAVRRAGPWRSWYRWATLAMLAHAFLVVAALTDRHLPPPGLISLTCNESSRHLWTLCPLTEARPFR